MKANSSRHKLTAFAVVVMLVCVTIATFKTRIDAFLLDGTYTLKNNNGVFTLHDKYDPEWKTIARNIVSASAFQRLAQDLGQSEFEPNDNSNERYVYLAADGTNLFIVVEPLIDGNRIYGDFPLNYSWNNGKFIDMFPRTREVSLTSPTDEVRK